MLLPRRPSALLAGAVLAAALGACGDDGPTREAYVSTADRLCEEHNQALDDLSEPATVEGLEDHLRDAVETSRDGLRELRSLEKPAEDLRRTVAVLDATAERADGLRRAADALAEDDLDLARERLLEAAASAESLEDRAREVGFVHCGAGPAIEEGALALLGGADGTTSTTAAAGAATTSSLPADVAAYLARADEECVEAARAAGEPQDVETLPELGRRIDEVVRTYRRLVVRLQGLPQPAAIDSELTRFYAAYDTLLDRLADQAAAAKRDDPEATEAAGVEVGAAEDELRAAAKATGFASCGLG